MHIYSNTVLKLSFELLVFYQSIYILCNFYFYSATYQMEILYIYYVYLTVLDTTYFSDARNSQQ